MKAAPTRAMRLIACGQVYESLERQAEKSPHLEIALRVCERRMAAQLSQGADSHA